MRTTTKHKPLLMRAATTLLLALLTMTAQTAWAQTTVTVSYIDADGTTQTLQPDEYTLLTGGEATTLSDAGWYVATGEVSYTGTVTFGADVNIILADGCSMSIAGNNYGIHGGDNSLTIYGQPLGTGTLNVTSTGDVGIYAIDGVTINGGTVNTTGIASDGNVTINGGKVTSTNDPGILSNSGDIILGWTSTTDFIKASSYICYSGTVKVADGMGLTDGTNSYSGTLSADAIAEKTLQPHWAGSGTSDSPYTISRTQELDLLAYRVNGTHDQTAVEDGYRNKYFRLGADIAYTYTKAWNEATSEEDNNYEAIGYYDGENDCYFRGDFDGAGHTISGIRIHRSGKADADKYQGIFGQTTSDANIHGLRLADARITGYDYTSGIVGKNDGTVTDCHVASNVCIHAVQSDAYDHGGIAGLNDGGTVANCTSAATFTIPSGNTSCYYYGAIAGFINSGTLSDNLAIGATVPAATTNNYHGAIVGYNYDGTLENNYYAACTVAGVANAVGVGCGGISDGNDGYTVADIDGAVPALRDNADNAQAIALLAALASTADGHTPVDLGWGPGQFPLQLAGRTLYKDGSWNTLCLPFSVSALDGTPLEGAEVKTLTGSSFADGTLTMTFSEESETTLTAGTPYIVRWTKPDGYEGNPSDYDLATPVFTGVTASTTTANVETDYVDFIGILSPTVICEDDAEKHNLYLGAANTLYYPTAEDFKVNALRGYFRLKNGLAAGEPTSASRAVRAFALNFFDEQSGEAERGDEATGIVSVSMGGSFPADPSATAAWYTLDGRRLSGKPGRSGVYITNGKKMVVK